MAADYEWFKKNVYDLTKIDLNAYKEKQMKRRIDTLIGKYEVNGYDGFFNLIKKDREALDSFVTYLTINVSEFFRTPDKFGKLETDVIPDLLKRSPTLNIWSAGCSIGAEVYSLTMILKDLTPGKKHRLLATDLDIEIIAKAKKGVYSDNELKALDPKRKDKYFTKTSDGKYAIKDEIKQCVEFKRHNLLKDPFEKGFDLILCRNVVIYFTEEAKDKLYRNFFASLKPGGILFVGATEAILNARNMGYVNYQPFFYQKPL